MQADLGLSGFAAGLLATLPVLAFGAFAPLAPRLTRRISIERVLLACALLTAAAAGPWLLGAVHDATGGWTVALVALAAICALELAPGLPAARARTLEGRA